MVKKGDATLEKACLLCVVKNPQSKQTRVSGWFVYVPPTERWKGCRPSISSWREVLTRVCGLVQMFEEL